MEETPDGIEYDWWVTGPDGAHYELYPDRDRTAEEIDRAKRWLRNSFDVVSIKVTRKALA